MAFCTKDAAFDEKSKEIQKKGAFAVCYNVVRNDIRSNERMRTMTKIRKAHGVLLCEQTSSFDSYTVSYGLYVSRWRGRFVLMVRDVDSRVCADLGADLACAYSLYRLLCENTVAPCHVFDVIEDQKQMD